MLEAQKEATKYEREHNLIRRVLRYLKGWKMTDIRVKIEPKVFDLINSEQTDFLIIKPTDLDLETGLPYCDIGKVVGLYKYDGKTILGYCKRTVTGYNIYSNEKHLTETIPESKLKYHKTKKELEEHLNELGMGDCLLVMLTLKKEVENAGEVRNRT